MPQVTDTEISSKTIALLQLLEDESPMVRSAVSQALRSLNMDIIQFARERRIPLSDAQHAALDSIFWDRHRQELLQAWEAWLEEEEGPVKLEKALHLLSHLQNGTRPRPSLSMALNELTDRFSLDDGPATPAALARFLFDGLSFTAIPEGSESSDGINVSLVVERRHGLPVSLVCIYILLGHRLGFDITGCNWPGSYYARYREDGVLYLVDFSNHGSVSTMDELLRLQGPSRAAAESVITLDMTSSMLVRRITSKLALYYRREGNARNSMLTVELLRALDRRIQQPDANNTAIC